MLPRNWSVACEEGEMRYKFRIKCRKVFQLIDSSDIGFSLRAITLRVKIFNNASYMLQNKKKYFCYTPCSILNKQERFLVEDLVGKEVTFIPFI
jgi:hypothetical protein